MRPIVARRRNRGEGAVEVVVEREGERVLDLLLDGGIVQFTAGWQVGWFDCISTKERWTASFIQSLPIPHLDPLLAASLPHARTLRSK